MKRLPTSVEWWAAELSVRNGSDRIMAEFVVQTIESCVDQETDIESARARHVEPHKCPRAEPSSACDFNRFGPGQKVRG